MSTCFQRRGILFKYRRRDDEWDAYDADTKEFIEEVGNHAACLSYSFWHGRDKTYKKKSNEKKPSKGKYFKEYHVPESMIGG